MAFITRLKLNKLKLWSTFALCYFWPVLNDDDACEKNHFSDSSLNYNNRVEYLYITRVSVHEIHDLPRKFQRIDQVRRFYWLIKVPPMMKCGPMQFNNYTCMPHFCIKQVYRTVIDLFLITYFVNANYYRSDRNNSW